jgi:hypothetical protein
VMRRPANIKVGDLVRVYGVHDPAWPKTRVGLITEVKDDGMVLIHFTNGVSGKVWARSCEVIDPRHANHGHPDGETGRAE